MSDKPKYKVGDEVDFCNHSGVITAVHEHHYFYGADSTYFLYDIDYKLGGSVKQVSEAALSLTAAKKSEIITKKRSCECGAWATGSNADEHSRWCPQYGREPEKEKK